METCNCIGHELIILIIWDSCNQWVNADLGAFCPVSSFSAPVCSNSSDQCSASPPQEVVKHFDGNHHGFHSLESAHQAMVRIGNHINEVKKQKENRQRVEDLQSNTTGWTGKDVS